MRSLQSSLFSRLNKPNFHNLQEKHSSSRIISVTLLWIYSNSSMTFLCSEPQAWTRDSRLDFMRAEGMMIPFILLLSLFWCSPGYCWPSWLQAHHTQLFIHKNPKVLFCKATSQEVLPLCTHIWIVLTQEHQPAVNLIESHQVFLGPIFKFVYYNILIL